MGLEVRLSDRKSHVWLDGACIGSFFRISSGEVDELWATSIPGGPSALSRQEAIDLVIKHHDDEPGYVCPEEHQ